MTGRRPKFDTSDALRKSLRHSGIGVQTMASELGVARSTVSNWLSGKVVPSSATLRVWADTTGVDYAWLLDPEAGEES